MEQEKIDSLLNPKIQVHILADKIHTICVDWKTHVEIFILNGPEWVMQKQSKLSLEEHT